MLNNIYFGIMSTTLLISVTAKLARMDTIIGKLITIAQIPIVILWCKYAEQMADPFMAIISIGLGIMFSTSATLDMAIGFECHEKMNLSYPIVCFSWLYAGIWSIGLMETYRSVVICFVISTILVWFFLCVFCHGFNIFNPHSRQAFFVFEVCSLICFGACSVYFLCIRE